MTSTRETLQSVVARLAEVIDQLPADPPEVPDTIEQWPEDDSHLRGEFWEDRDGDVWRWEPSKLVWQMWSHERREWAGKTSSLAWMNYTLTRTVDPSAPRTWDTLCDVPEDVERVSGDYAGTRRKLARSPLSESGWFLRYDGPFGGWMELSADRTGRVTNIKETP